MRFITGMAVSAVVVSVLIFNSCSKQELKEQTAAGKQEVQMSDEDVAVYNKIMTFKKKVDYIKENPNYKSGETITVDSAVWYLEITINYNYGHPDGKYNNIYNHADSVYLNNSSIGVTTMNDVVLAYDLIISKISYFYYGIDEDQKDFILTDISESETQNGQTKISFTASVGSAWDNYVYPFDETDFWYFGQGMGKCGPYSGNFGEDAASKIFDMLPYYQPICIPGPGYMVVYSDVETINSYDEFILNQLLFRNPDDPEPVDNWLDYYMFYASSEYGDQNLDENEECLDTLEMNFYFNGVQTMIYNKFPTITDPPDKTFIKCTYLWGEWYSSDEYSGVILHNGYFQYGILHVIPVEEDIPEEL